MEEEEKRRIFHEMMQKCFMKCDRFMIEKWKTTEKPLSQVIEDEVRQNAYYNFYDKVSKAKIASRPTIQKWFGIHGQSMPKREQIIHLAFVCQFSVDETREYFMYAISEHDFQVNDYHEMIALYGLENHMTYEQYKEMVAYFEQYSDWNVPVRQTAHTDEILRRYEPVKNLDTKEFLVWMRKNEALFKGYSMTTYQNYMALLEKALAFFRKDIKQCLFTALEDVGFFSWLKNNDIKEEDYGKEIRRFIKNQTRLVKSPLSKEKVKEIQFLTKMAYSPLRRVSDSIVEIYDGIHFPHTRFGDMKRNLLQKEIGAVDAKYISDISSIAKQKEKEMRLLQAYTKCRTGKTDGETKLQELEKEIRKQRQRTHNIRRADLLVLIHYVVLKQSGEESPEVVKKEFVAMADSILNLCGMRPMDDKYPLDYLLLQCFGSVDVYTLTDVLE